MRLLTQNMQLLTLDSHPSQSRQEMAEIRHSRAAVEGRKIAHLVSQL